jgi:hypothetical protein
MSGRIASFSVGEDPAAVTDAPAVRNGTPEVETAPTVAEHPCDVCPTRSTAENQTFDYCEGCPRVERECPGCRQYRPQSGWWWGPGAYFSATAWVCAGCRYPPLDAQAAVKYPDVAASHPALRDMSAGWDRFAATLELEGVERRFEAAQALSRATSMLPSDEAGLVLGRMAGALRDPGFMGTLDVDVADVDLLSRQRVTVALHTAAYGMHTSSTASGPLARLMRQWESWTDAQLPERTRPLAGRERQAREREHVRRGRERTAG